MFLSYYRIYFKNNFGNMICFVNSALNSLGKFDLYNNEKYPLKSGNDRTVHGDYIVSIVPCYTLWSTGFTGFFIYLVIAKYFIFHS